MYRVEKIFDASKEVKAWVVVKYFQTFEAAQRFADKQNAKITNQVLDILFIAK